MSDFDATVVGAGPNGLAAAIELARTGHKTLLVEAADKVGGGARTGELTLPGFHHDICSAIHPSGVASPFYEEIGLEIDWVQPPIPFSHPLDGGEVVVLRRSVDDTANGLGADARSYRRLMAPIVERIDDYVDTALGPVTLLPDHFSAFVRLGVTGGLPVSILSRSFSTRQGQALWSGVAAHAIAPFSGLATSAVGLMLGAIAHSHGWPMARGGSQTISDALAARFEELGGKIELGRTVDSVDELPDGKIFLDVMPPAAFRIARHRISVAKARRLSRWKPGPGVFKVDWALDGPIPWADHLSRDAATVHLGGRYAEVASAERSVAKGGHPRRPFVLLAQQSLFDDTRAPDGKHTAWGYCHVPNGSTVDMTDPIEGQIERFAPGFKDLILARTTRGPAEFQTYNPNYLGGDIGGGRYGLTKVLQIGARSPYSLGGDVYLCSSATPPGAGVHGMCGYHAVRASLA